MREWRRIYRSITSSDRLAKVSDSAWRLYVLLLVNQDDQGSIPWTRTMVRTLIAGSTWTEEQAATWAKELMIRDLVKADGDMLTIRRGAELNGPPKSGSQSYKTPRLYPPSTEAILPQEVRYTSPGSPRVREELEERRGEETTPSTSSEASEVVSPLKGGAPQKNTNNQKPKTKTHWKKLPRTIEGLQDGLVETLVKEYAWAWSAERVREKIAGALDHDAARKRTNAWLYLDGWLRRDAERMPTEWKAAHPDPQRFTEGRYGHLVQR